MTIPAEIFVDVNISLTGAAADKFAFGALLGVFDHAIKVGTERIKGPYADLAAVVTAGFTAAAEPEANAWAASVFSQANGVDAVTFGRIDVGDADLTASLDAIEAEIGVDGFYLLNTESRVDTDVLLAAAWAEARTKIYIAQCADADILTGAADNLAEDLADLGYHRTGLIYHQYDDSTEGDVITDGYLDAAWSSYCGGFDLDGPAGVGIWGLQQLAGVTYDGISGTEAAAVHGNDGNVYGRTKGLSFTSHGTMASGRFIDVTSTIDWMTERLQEEILSLFVGEPRKIAITSGGMNRIHAASQGVADLGITYGHQSPDVPTIFTLPKLATISDANRLLRAITITASTTLASGIQKVTYNITVTP